MFTQLDTLLHLVARLALGGNAIKYWLTQSKKEAGKMERKKEKRKRKKNSSQRAYHVEKSIQH